MAEPHLLIGSVDMKYVLQRGQVKIPRVSYPHAIETCPPVAPRPSPQRLRAIQRVPVSTSGVAQACANDFWAVLRDYAAAPPAAVLTQQASLANLALVAHSIKDLR